MKIREIEILLSYRCNSRCMYCVLPEHSRAERMPDEEVVRLMRWAKEQGAAGVSFSGGEPTIDERIVNLVRLAAKLGFERIKIRSNGMMASYPGFVDRLLEAGLTRFSLSLKSHEGDVHDRLSRSPGGFRLVMKAVENLAGREIEFECDYLVHGMNFRLLPEAAEFFYSAGLRAFNFQYVSSYFNPAGELAGLLAPMGDAAPYLIEACLRLEGRKVKWVRSYDTPPCFLYPNNRFYHNVAGDDLVVADPGGSTFRVEDTPLHGKIKIAVCGGCVFDSECSGLREDYLDIFGGRDVRAVKPAAGEV